ncbi:MAG TPA: ABC transporter permease [Armatimonadota bacterium]|jgi:ABC-2 type transport system permease protein
MVDLILIRATLRELLRPRRLAIAAVLVLLPSLLAAVWRHYGEESLTPELAYNALSTMLVFGFTLPILSVLFGTSAVSQEVEQRTIVYILSRPVARARILLARFLGGLIGITLTLCVAALLLAMTTYGFSDLGSSRLSRDLLILPVGALAYGSLSLLLATAVDRSLVYGLFFVFGWESWVPMLPGKFGEFSVMAHLRVLAPHPQPETATMDIGSLLQAMTPQAISAATAKSALLWTILLALAMAAVVFSVKEYAPREDAE